MKTWKEIAEEILELGFRTAWLETARGVTLVSKNQPKTAIERQLQKIGNYMEKATLVDGWYVVKAQANISSKDQPLSYKLWVGASRPQDMGEQKPEAMNQNFSIDLYLKQLQDLADAKAELVYLRKENERLQARVEHLEETNDGLREGAQTMAAGIPTPKPMIEQLSELLVGGAPIITGIIEMVKEQRAAQKPAQDPQLAKIASMLAAMQKGQQEQAAKLAELERRQQQALADGPQQLTLEDLANLVIDGKVTEDRARQALAGEDQETIAKFDTLLYGE